MNRDKRSRRAVYAAFGWLLCVGPRVMAQTAPIASSTRDLTAASNLAHSEYRQGRYGQAAAILAPYLHSPSQQHNEEWFAEMYNLACYYARSGQTDLSIQSLTAAESEENIVSTKQLTEDPDLSSVRARPDFQQLVAQSKTREKLWVSEPGADLPYSDAMRDDQKAAALSIVWAEARYGFAFFDRLPQLDWNKLYFSYLAKVRNTQSTLETYRVLAAFAAELKDGHTNVSFPRELWDSVYARPGIRTSLVDGKVIVVDILDPKLAAAGWTVGDEIIQVNGVEVHRYAEANVAPYASASTLQDRNVRLYDYQLLQGKAEDTLDLLVENAHGMRTARSLLRLPIATQADLKATPRISFGLLPSGFSYLLISEFEDDSGFRELLAHINEIEATKGLIIDVRRNGGGNTDFGYSILQVLADKPFNGAPSRSVEYNAKNRAHGITPGWRTEAGEPVLPDRQHHLDVPVAVLTSAATFSAAEDFVAAFDSMQRGIIVGEPTGGSTGQPLSFPLPGGGSARVCTKDDTEPDGTKFEGVGIRPQIVVTPTVSSVRQGRDIVLDRAIEALQRRSYLGLTKFRFLQGPVAIH